MKNLEAAIDADYNEITNAQVKRKKHRKLMLAYLLSAAYQVSKVPNFDIIQSGLQGDVDGYLGELRVLHGACRNSYGASSFLEEFQDSPITYPFLNTLYQKWDRENFFFKDDFFDGVVFGLALKLKADGSAFSDLYNYLRTEKVELKKGYERNGQREVILSDDYFVGLYSFLMSEMDHNSISEPSFPLQEFPDAYYRYANFFSDVLYDGLGKVFDSTKNS